eukprot:8959107-Pyramimonas_sp.AAC.1
MRNNIQNIVPELCFKSFVYILPVEGHGRREASAWAQRSGGAMAGWRWSWPGVRGCLAQEECWARLTSGVSFYRRNIQKLSEHGLGTIFQHSL